MCPEKHVDIGQDVVFALSCPPAEESEEHLVVDLPSRLSPVGLGGWSTPVQVLTKKRAYYLNITSGLLMSIPSSPLISTGTSGNLSCSCVYEWKPLLFLCLTHNPSDTKRSITTKVSYHKLSSIILNEVRCCPQCPQKPVATRSRYIKL